MAERTKGKIGELPSTDTVKGWDSTQRIIDELEVNMQKTIDAITTLTEEERRTRPAIEPAGMRHLLQYNKKILGAMHTYKAEKKRIFKSVKWGEREDIKNMMFKVEQKAHGLIKGRDLDDDLGLWDIKEQLRRNVARLKESGGLDSLELKIATICEFEDLQGAAHIGASLGNALGWMLRL